MLLGEWVPVPFPDVATFVLVPAEKDAFMVGSMINGKLVDLMNEWVFEFMRKGGKVAEFGAWTDGDKLDGTGRRQ